MEFGIEKCAMLVMKSGKRHLMDGMELPNQEKIKTFRGKETYIYMGYWKMILPNNRRWKKKNKSISEEPESYPRQNYIVETLSNE